MKVVTLYKAFDEKVFNTEKECLEYEASQKPYTVDLFFNGHLRVHVRAVDREKAIEIAKDSFYYDDVDLNLIEDEIEVIEGEE